MCAHDVPFIPMPYPDRGGPTPLAWRDGAGRGEDDAGPYPRGVAGAAGRVAGGVVAPQRRAGHVERVRHSRASVERRLRQLAAEADDDLRAWDEPDVRAV